MIGPVAALTSNDDALGKFVVSIHGKRNITAKAIACFAASGAKINPLIVEFIRAGQGNRLIVPFASFTKNGLPVDRSVINSQIRFGILKSVLRTIGEGWMVIVGPLHTQIVDVSVCIGVSFTNVPRDVGGL